MTSIANRCDGSSSYPCFSHAAHEFVHLKYEEAIVLRIFPHVLRASDGDVISGLCRGTVFGRFI